MNLDSIFEPQRGGIVLIAVYAAPTELRPAVGRAWRYRDVAPTELKRRCRFAATADEPMSGIFVARRAPGGAT